MVVDSLVEIVGDAGVVGAVAAEDDVVKAPGGCIQHKGIITQ